MARCDDIFKRTKHPYTEGLFDSLPNIKERSARLKPDSRAWCPIPPVCCSPAAPLLPAADYATEACKMAVAGTSLHAERATMSPAAAYDDPNFKIRKGGESR